MKTNYSGKKVMTISCMIFFCIALFLTSAKAQTVELVKDINPSGTSSVTNMIDLNGMLIFGAYETAHGSELWKSNGTAAGTIRIKDINPGTANANVMNFIYYNGKIYFSADDGVHGREIWVSNGDSTGTFMLKDINPSGSGSFSNAILFNNLLFFNADDGTHGSEWWTTDGTVSGTQLFVDSSNIGGGPEKPYIYNNKLYFAYNDGTHGREPWVTDGTPAGTHLLLNINQSTSLNSLPEGFTEYNGLLYFGADNGVDGNELWVTDGTPGGTQMIEDIRPGSIGSIPRYFITYNNLLFFATNDGSNGVELWASNGTALGTYMFKDLNTTGSSDLIGFVEYNDQLFFSAIDNTYGREPWFCDGSDQGTQILKDINTTGNSMPGYFSIPAIPTEFGGKLYFAAEDGTNGYELWLTDGTVSGTQMIEPSVASGISPLVNLNEFEISDGAMYFGADYTGAGEDLYRVVDVGAGVSYINTDADKMRVFPIPSNGNFWIEFTSLINTIAQIEILNMLGEIVWETNIYAKAGNNSMQFNESRMDAGIYFCKIIMEEKQISGKFIVH